MRCNRTGFNSIDLLAALAFGSLIVALTMPVLQMAREEARRLRCQKHLGNIGRASLDYEVTFGEFPPYMARPFSNLSNYDGLDYQFTFPMTQLLEFLNEPNVASQIDPFAFCSDDVSLQAMGYVDFRVWINGVDDALPGVSAIVTDNQLAILRCPSDVSADREFMIRSSQPIGFLTIPFPGLFQTTGDEFSITNYATNIGSLNLYQVNHGPIRTRESDSFDEVGDGAANVFMFGESLGIIDHLFELDLDIRYSMGLGGIAHGRPDIFFSKLPSFFGTTEFSTEIQFGTAHPKTVNMIRCDGSTNSIDRMVDREIFSQLCASADGLPVQP